LLVACCLSPAILDALEPLEIVGLGLAAFAAGAINAIAGGGTLIAFPALLAAGYSAKVSNVTNTVAVWLGTVGGSFAYRKEISDQRRTITAIAVPTVIGAVAGSALLLSTPDATFDIVVPFLILGACLLLALQDRLTRMVTSSRLPLNPGLSVWLIRAGVFLVALYGGYFGAAMGIIMLAIFGLLLPDDIQHVNALKGFVAMSINSIAAAYFAVFGEVAWEAAAVMAVCSLAGGYLGVGFARRLRRDRLRAFAVTYGTIAALVLLTRNF
jgi:uncharacterized membrane protein YfcA